MSVIFDESGASRLKVFLWFAFLGLVIYVALKIVPMYMDYARMKDTMTVKAGVAQVLKDEEILKDVVQKAKELGLPLGPEDFILVRDNESRRMKISTKWDVRVSFFGRAYVRTFHFEPVVEESFMSIAR